MSEKRPFLGVRKPPPPPPVTEPSVPPNIRALLTTVRQAKAEQKRQRKATQRLS